MARRTMLSLVPILALGLAGCDDDTPETTEDPLPKLPQMMVGAREGVLGFSLTLQGDSMTIDAVFLNGGQDPLEIYSAEIVNETADVFEMVTPLSLTVESRKAIAFPITFTSPGRGVYLADFVVKSNAENLPTVTLQLVAPGAGLRIPEVPDIQPFETEVEMQQVAGLSVPAALVRIYNLGGPSLELSSYTLADTSNFRFLVGTAIPNDVCKVGATCMKPSVDEDPAIPDIDGDGCCGILECETETPQDIMGLCSPVLVARGRFVLFGVTWADAASAGAHSTDVSVASNDPDQSVVTISIHGTR